jgi:hypothetical protein
MCSDQGAPIKTKAVKVSLLPDISAAAVALSQSAISASVISTAWAGWASPSWTTWTRPGSGLLLGAGWTIGASHCQVPALTRARMTVATARGRRR